MLTSENNVNFDILQKYMKHTCFYPNFMIKTVER